MRRMTLRGARHHRDLSLQQVAEALGIHRSTLSRIERGLEQPKPRLARAIHAFYEGKVDWPAIFLADPPADRRRK